MNGQRLLRLVEPPPQQARRRYEMHIVVSSARMPTGRSQVFRLAARDIEQLIVAAQRLEEQS